MTLFPILLYRLYNATELKGDLIFLPFRASYFSKKNFTFLKILMFLESI